MMFTQEHSTGGNEYNSPCLGRQNNKACTVRGSEYTTCVRRHPEPLQRSLPSGHIRHVDDDFGRPAPVEIHIYEIPTTHPLIDLCHKHQVIRNRIPPPALLRLCFL